MQRSQNNASVYNRLMHVVHKGLKKRICSVGCDCKVMQD